MKKVDHEFLGGTLKFDAEFPRAGGIDLVIEAGTPQAGATNPIAVLAELKKEALRISSTYLGKCEIDGMALHSPKALTIECENKDEGLALLDALFQYGITHKYFLESNVTTAREKFGITATQATPAVEASPFEKQNRAWLAVHAGELAALGFRDVHIARLENMKRAEELAPCLSDIIFNLQSPPLNSGFQPLPVTKTTPPLNEYVKQAVAWEQSGTASSRAAAPAGAGFAQANAKWHKTHGASLQSELGLSSGEMERLRNASDLNALKYDLQQLAGRGMGQPTYGLYRTAAERFGNKTNDKGAVRS